MFCNKCGKTLNPEAKACPSCGQPVGDSRFEGSGYTSSQVRFVPESPEQSGYAPYTKTTYSSSPDEGGDVYSRTSYRPALSEDEVRETTGYREPEPEEAPEDERQDAPEEPETGEDAPRSDMPAPQPEPEPRLDEDRDALGIEIRPLEPIRKTGISPEVQRYIQQMNQKKSRMQRKAYGQDGEGQDAAAADPGASDEGADHEEGAPEADARPARFSSGAGRWAMRIAGVMAVVVLLVVGVLFIADRTANRAKIPGVTYSLYTEGLSLIKSRTTSEYRTGIIKMWRADSTGSAVMQQQKTESDEITALLPEKPLENDQLFIDTLLSIQQSIDEVTATDALAALSAGETTLGTLTAESQEGWDLINNAISRLDIATEKADLDAIIKGVDFSNIATPEPEATPTPSPYKTLKKGMKNNAEVKKLQNRLSKLGWFNGVKDGDFGPATQTAVKKFQKAVGLEEDGIATVQMQELLYADSAPRGDGKTTAPAATESADAAETPAPEGGEGTT